MSESEEFFSPDIKFLRDMLRSKILTIDVKRAMEIVKSEPQGEYEDEAETHRAWLKRLCEEQSKSDNEFGYSYPMDDKAKMIDKAEAEEMRATAGEFIDDDDYYGHVTQEMSDKAKAEQVDDDTAEAPQEPAKSIFEELDVSLEPPKRMKHVKGSFPDFDSFKKPIEFVSQGNYGFVFRTELAGNPIVLKVSKTRSEEANMSDYNEWTISEKLDPHPNILKLNGLCPSFTHPRFPDAATTALSIPFMRNGGLEGFLKKSGFDRTDEWQLANVMFGMLDGIRSMHEQDIIHNDIALRNYLVSDTGRILLNDFGLARDLNDKRNKVDVKRSNEGKLSSDGPDRNVAPDLEESHDDGANRGRTLRVLEEGPNLATPWRWSAPESSLNKKFSKSSDMWMYGQAVVELVTERKPFHQLDAGSFERVVKNEELKLPDLSSAPKFVQEIVEMCCNLDPFARPTANEICAILKDRRWDVDYSKQPQFALHQVAKEGSFEVFKEKLETWHGPEVRDRNGMTAFHVAAECCDYGDDEFFEVGRGTMNEQKDAEQKDADLRFEITDKWGNNALHYFAKYGTASEDYNQVPFGGVVDDDDIDRRIASAFQNHNQRQETPLYTAVINTNNQDGVLERIMAMSVAFARLRVGASGYPTKLCNGRTVFHRAVADHNVGAIRELLAWGFLGSEQRDIQGRTPLLLAALLGYTEVARLLLNSGANAHAALDNGDNALHIAVKANNFDMIEELLSREHIPINICNKLGNTALQSTRNLAVAKLLIGCTNIDVNAQDGTSDGNTFLHQLIKEVTQEKREYQDVRFGKHRETLSPPDVQCRIELIEYVLEVMSSQVDELKDIDLNERNVFDINARKRNVFDINARNAYHETVLHLFGESSSTDLTMLKSLLQKLLSMPRVDVNAKSVYHATPILRAVTNPGVLKLFLEYDAVDINFRKPNGVTLIESFVRFSQVPFSILEKEAFDQLMRRKDLEVNPDLLTSDNVLKNEYAQQEISERRARENEH